MAHERGDDFRWLQIGNHYHKVSELVMRFRHEGQMDAVWGSGGRF